MKLLKVSVLAAVLFCVVVGSEVKLIPPVSIKINETSNPFLADDPLGFERMVITDDEEWLHNRINQLRDEKGLHPLHWNNNLTSASRFHSREMIENDYFAHESIDEDGKVYEGTFERFARFNYNHSPMGENIAGYSTKEQAYIGWFNSPGHYKNMTSSSYTESGLGMVVGGPCGKMWTHDFGYRTISYDLEITAADILAEQLDGNTLLVTAIIHNPGKTHAYPVMVRFYDGNPATGGQQIGADVKVPAIIIGQDYRPDTAKLEWDFCLKSMNDDSIETDIYVVVDPDDDFSETNESNNMAHINTKYLAVGEDIVLYPQGLEIKSTYPNPVTNTATITYALPDQMPVSLSIFDASGRKVRELVSGEQTAGNHEVVWDGADAAGSEVSAGVYIVSLRGAGKISTTNLVVVR